jgi:hypothetical protein
MADTGLRIGAWNCRQGVDRKREAFARLGVDVLVVPECMSRPRMAEELGVAFCWRGSYPAKGLGVFAFNGWSLEAVTLSEDLPWVLPVTATSPDGAREVVVLAVWTVAGGNHGRLSYAGQVGRVIDVWENELRDGLTVMAGDLNCSAQGPSSGPHRENVRRLHQLGVRSAYHHHTGDVHGEERAMTLRWFGRGSVESRYHCDFVFVSSRLLGGIEQVDVGSIHEWVASGLSDHCPVSVSLRL